MEDLAKKGGRTGTTGYQEEGSPLQDGQRQSWQNNITEPETELHS